MVASILALIHGAFDLAIEVNFGVIKDRVRFLFDTPRRIKGIAETSMIVPNK